MTGIEAFLDVLAAAGVRHIFGNPGTTELPLNDALATDRRFEYLFGLQEIPVLAMADGYAMAAGNVAVANVHICCGLGNAMGMLYNAHCSGGAVLLTAGQQDRQLRFGELRGQRELRGQFIQHLQPIDLASDFYGGEGGRDREPPQHDSRRHGGNQLPDLRDRHADPAPGG